eukprot:4854815-Prymnesium_polylepis.1
MKAHPTRPHCSSRPHLWRRSSLHSKVIQRHIESLCAHASAQRTRALLRPVSAASRRHGLQSGSRAPHMPTLSAFPSDRARGAARPRL